MKYSIAQLNSYLKECGCNKTFNSFKSIFDDIEVMRYFIPVGTRLVMIDLLIRDDFELTEKQLQITLSKLAYFNRNPEISPQEDRRIYRIANKVLFGN